MGTACLESIATVGGIVSLCGGGWCVRQVLIGHLEDCPRNCASAVSLGLYGGLRTFTTLPYKVLNT